MSRLSVRAATINSGRYDQSHDHCRLRQLSHCPRRLYRAAWTTATQYCEVCQTGSWDACNRYRTLPHDWKLVHHGATTSHWYCDSYQYDDVSTSRSPSWFSSAWLVTHLATWLRTVMSSLMSALADFDQLTQRPVSRAARPTSSTTDASQLPVHGYGTRCQSI